MQRSTLALAFLALLGEPLPGPRLPWGLLAAPGCRRAPPRTPLASPTHPWPAPSRPPPPGAAQAASYPSVTAAVKALPELSTLAAKLDGTAFASDLSDPAFVGTVFLPTDAAMAKLSAQVRPRRMRFLPCCAVSHTPAPPRAGQHPQAVGAAPEAASALACSAHTPLPPTTSPPPHPQIGTDFKSMMSQDPEQATAVLSYSVVPGTALLSSALKDGMSLTTKNGEAALVSVKK
jgi:uncharacterized surface protein with fasciclin (FAS1) repeats